MARSYKRDANGRFASTGGVKRKSSGAPKSKSAATRAANEATTKRLMDKGLTGTGSRLRSKNQSLYSGSKATKQRQESIWRGKESNQRNAALGENTGAQRSKIKVGGTVRRRK